MTDITLLLSLSASLWLAPYLAGMLRLPSAPVEIVLGSLLAWMGLIHEHVYFDLVANVGFLYLMFLAGLEVNLRDITTRPGSTIRKAILFVIALGFMGGVGGFLLGMNPITILTLPLVSLGLLASLSKTYGKEAPWLQLAFIVGVIGEMTSIATLTIFDAASTVGFGKELAMEMGYLMVFIAGIYLLYRLLQTLFWWHPEIKALLIPKLDAFDQDIRLAMALFFILIAVMLMLHLELALGAFIAGVAIAAFFHREKALEAKLSSLGFGFLIPLFFMHVGASFDVAFLKIPSVITGALTITATVFTIRILAAFFLRSLIDKRSAVLVSLALSMPLTLQVAVATIGYTTHYIGLIPYYQLILASLLEVIIAMVSITFIHSGRDTDPSSPSL